jgi:thioredoxin-like negative regulator of GroEL
LVCAKNDLVRNEAAAYIDDLRAFKVPLQPRAQHWYAVDGTRQRVLSEARATIEKGADYAVLGELEHASGAPEAADYMLQAATLDPTAQRWLRAAQFLDDPLRKFTALRNGLALEPSNSRLNVELAAYYVGRQQLEKARDVLSAAGEAAPNDFVIRERKASLILNLGLRSAALPELRRLEKQWPAPLWLRARLALDYEQTGLLDDAARLAASVVAEKSDDREQLALLARFHERRHMKYDLQADYIALSRLEPAQPDIWSRLAQVQIDCGDAEGARKSLLRMIALDEENPCTWIAKPSRSAPGLLASRGQISWLPTLNTWLTRGCWSRTHLTSRRIRPIRHWPISGCRNFCPAGWTACTSSSFTMSALNPHWTRTVSARFAIRHPPRNCVWSARAHGNPMVSSWMRRSWVIVNMPIRWFPCITTRGCASFALPVWKKATSWNWNTRSFQSGAPLPTAVISASLCYLPAEARRN